MQEGKKILPYFSHKMGSEKPEQINFRQYSRLSTDQQFLMQLLIEGVFFVWKK